MTASSPPAYSPLATPLPKQAKTKTKQQKQTHLLPTHPTPRMRTPIKPHPALLIPAATDHHAAVLPLTATAAPAAARVAAREQVAAARGRDQGPAGDGYGVAAERRLPRARVEGRAEAVFVDDVDVAAGEGPGFLAAHFFWCCLVWFGLVSGRVGWLVVGVGELA
jgi:hypothetical protein